MQKILPVPGKADNENHLNIRSVAIHYSLRNLLRLFHLYERTEENGFYVYHYV